MTASSGFLAGQLSDLRRQLRQIIIDVSSKANSGANTDIMSVYLSNTGLVVKDTDASHGLTIRPGSNITANRTLTLATGDADRLLTLSGDATLSGTNTGDQTITLSGDVTGSGSSSFAATIASNAVTNDKIRQSSGLSVIGRSANTDGNVEDISAISDFQVLRRSGLSIGFGAVNLASNNAVSGTLPNNKTTATDANTASAIVARDSSGNFTAGTVTLANLNLSSITNGYFPKAGVSGLLAGSIIYQGTGPVATGIGIGGTDIRGIATVQTSSTSAYATDIDMGDLGRFFVMQNNSTSAAANQFSNISLQIYPTGSLSGGRCLADIRLIRETANQSNSFFLFSGFRQGGSYKDFFKIGFDYSWTTSRFYIGGKTQAAAVLHLAAGTASANTAPLKFTSGTNLTTAEAGTEEYNGSFYQTKASALRYGLGGCIADFTTDANNSGTSETDLYSYTTPASTLANTGEKIIARFAGTFNDASSTAQLRAYFAGTLIFDTGAATVGTVGSWDLTLMIIRTGSSTARAIVTLVTASMAYTYSQDKALTQLTFTNTNILKVTGTAGGASGGSNDITAKLGSIDWRAAA